MPDSIVAKPPLSGNRTHAVTCLYSRDNGSVALRIPGPSHLARLEAPPAPLGGAAMVEVPPGPAPGPAPGAYAVGRRLDLARVQWLREAPVLLQGVNADPPRPGLQVLAPGDRVGPEANRIEQLDVPQPPLDGFELEALRRPPPRSALDWSLGL